MQSWSGRAWLVEDQAGRLVVKLSGATEVEATKAAAAAGIGPRVLSSGGVDDETGWVAVEFVVGEHERTLELRRPTTIDAVADLLRRWHQVPTESLALLTTGLADVRRSALAQLRAAQRALPPGHLLASADELESQLVHDANTDVPAHLDVAANLLRVDGRLVLLDFEYAALAPPERELGQFAWESELRQAETERLVEGYVKGQTSAPISVSRVAGWAFITAVTWVLWGACRPGMELWTTRTEERLKSYWWDPMSFHG
jgi:hypothetical protein